MCDCTRSQSGSCRGSPGQRGSADVEKLRVDLEEDKSIPSVTLDVVFL